MIRRWIYSLIVPARALRLPKPPRRLREADYAYGRDGILKPGVLEQSDTSACTPTP